MDVGIAEAKDRLSELVDRVERGEEVTITRHGRPAVTMNPARRRPNPEEVERVFDEIAAHRHELPNLTDDEIVERIREGRRY